MAAVTAGIQFWSGWVDAAKNYAKAINVELAALDADPDSGGEFGGRLTDLTREYLRQMTELPTVAVKHFNSELEAVGRPKPRSSRQRAARAKE